MEQADVSSPSAGAHRCVICLHDPEASTSARIKGCDHGPFCLDCIRRWCNSRPSPRCPLCQGPVTVLCHSGGEEAVQPPDKPTDEGPDLGCLDHAYFKADASRLLIRAKRAQMHLVRESYGSSRRGCARANDATDMLQQLIHSLEQVRHDMEQEIPFLPEDLLHHLYEMDQMVSSIAAGDFSVAPPTSSGGSGAAAGPMSADDAAAWHEHGWEQEDSYSDYSDGDDPDALHHAAARRLDRGSIGGGGSAGGGKKSLSARRRSSSGSLQPSKSTGSLSGGGGGAGRRR